MDRMPNHTVLRELSTAVHAAIRRQVIQEVIFNDSPRGASCQDIVARTFFQIRERPEFPAQVPAFFGWNARNRLISRRLQEKKKKKKGEEEGRKKTDKRRRASGRTNQRTKASVEAAAAEEEKEEKKARQSAFAFTRFSARFVLSAVQPMSSLFPLALG